MMFDAYFQCECGNRRNVLREGERWSKVTISVYWLREVSYESCNMCGKYNKTVLVIDETVQAKKGEKDAK